LDFDYLWSTPASDKDFEIIFFFEMVMFHSPDCPMRDHRRQASLQNQNPFPPTTEIRTPCTHPLRKTIVSKTGVAANLRGASPRIVFSSARKAPISGVNIIKVSQDYAVSKTCVK